MTDSITSILFGIGVGTWVYTKVMHSTGGNYKSSYIVAGIIGVFAGGLFYLAISHLFHS